MKTIGFNGLWRHRGTMWYKGLWLLVKKVPTSIPNRDQIILFPSLSLHYHIRLVGQEKWMTKTSQSVLIWVMPNCLYTSLMASWENSVENRLNKEKISHIFLRKTWSNLLNLMYYLWWFKIYVDMKIMILQFPGKSLGNKRLNHVALEIHSKKLYHKFQAS